MADMQLTAGSVLDDRFELIAAVGAGGMGVVYHARQTALQRDVAIKILRSELCNDESDLKRFEREAQNLSKLGHPNIVSVYSVGCVEGLWYMAMQYVPAPSLQSMIRKGPLPVKTAVDIFMQICSALACAHKHGIVHRDIKPSNILVADQATVIDFGLSKLLGAETPEQRLTRTGTALGTAMYMSPEQCSGQEVDARSDIYALGILLYELLAGEQPFEGDNAIAFMHHHVNSVVPPLPSTDPDAWKFSDVIAKATQKRPADRYQTVEELMAEMMEASNSKAPSLPPAIQQVARGADKSNKTLFVTLLIAGIIAVSALIRLALNQNQDEAISLQDDAPFAYWLALRDKQTFAKDYKGAYESAKRAVALAPPDDRGNIVTAAECAMSAGEYVDALRFYDRVLEKQPGNYNCKYGSVRAYRALKDWQGVERVSAELVAMPEWWQQNDCRLTVESRLVALQELNRLKDAKRFSDAVAAKMPEPDPDIDEQRALIEYKLGNHRQAAIIAQRCWRHRAVPAAILAYNAWMDGDAAQFALWKRRASNQDNPGADKAREILARCKPEPAVNQQ